ncbi:MAG: amino acid adenylation domain-containing protein [Pseudomonadota bacterium]
MENVDDIYTLTPAQLGMLFHCLEGLSETVYVSQVTVAVRGQLDASCLEGAWKATVARHPALRTAFLWDGLDAPVQVVHTAVELPWLSFDWSDLSEAEQQTRLSNLRANEYQRQFDLAEAPLMRVCLVQHAPSQFSLVWTVHHLIADGWSQPLVLRDVLAAAGGQMGDADAPPPYRDYVAWIQGKSDQFDSDYWTKYLDGIETPASLATLAQSHHAIHRSTGQSELGDGHGRVGYSLAPELTVDLQRTASENRVTLSTLIHAAWAILLARYNESTDVVFGTTLSGRHPDVADVEAMVGNFTNTLPVRIGLSDNEPLSEWLRDLQRLLVGLREREYTSLADVQRTHSARTAGFDRSLFDTLVVFENYPTPDTRLDRIDQWDVVEHSQHSNYPLALLAVPGERLELWMVHDRARYPTAFCEMILARIESVLAQICASSSAALGRVSAVLPDELGRVHDFGRGASVARSPETVVSRITAWFEATPNKTAVVCGDEAITYAALDTRSGALAALLKARGVTEGDRIGVGFERGVDAVVAIVGVLRAGAAYCPLDPEYPTERINQILSEASLRALVAKPQTVALWRDGDAEVLRDLDIIDALPEGPYDAEAVADPAGPSPAYVIFTSGSTGRPRGVEVSHANLANSTAARDHYYPQSPSAFLLLSPFAFDSSVVGLFWTLATGGTLVVSQHRAEQDIDGLSKTIETHSVTHTLCLPSLYRVALTHAPAERLASLRTVILAGEAFPNDGLVDSHRAKLPAARIYNEYGPTEATVWCSVHDATDHDGASAVPIGGPVAESSLMVIDQGGRECPIGWPGEIWVGGAGVVDGYLNDAEGSLSAFVERPGDPSGHPTARWYRTGDRGYWRADGALMFLGRNDGQVKVLGHRIEIGDVNDAIERQASVAESVVLAVTPDAEAQALVDALSDLDEQTVRALLERAGTAARPA